LGTGWARVYAGAHYPLDVLAGLLLGGGAGLSMAAAIGAA
jgi:membrane-associated phospholipid phosphatase